MVSSNKGNCIVAQWYTIHWVSSNQGDCLIAQYYTTQWLVVIGNSV